MSEEDAKAFLKKVGEDKELQEKIKGVDSQEDFFWVAKTSGFDFTKEELIQATPPSRRALSEEELSEVSGGGHQHQFHINVQLPRDRCGNGLTDGSFDYSRCEDHDFQQCHRQECSGH